MNRILRTSLFVALASLVISVGAPATAHAGTVSPRLPLPPPPASAPVILTAEAGNARVALTWQTVDGATSYAVFRAADGVWGATPITTTTRTSFTNTGLTNGMLYSFRIAAVNRGGAGPQSADATAMPLAPPATVLAMAGDQQVTLSWDASAGALTYDLFRSTTGAEGTWGQVANLSAVMFVDAGLTNGTRSYYYRLRALGPLGMSGWSVKVNARPVPPPPGAAPNNVTANPGNARVTLAWESVTGATGYRIFRTRMGGLDPKVIKTSALTFKDSNLTNGETYEYRIAGYNLGGDGPQSAMVLANPVAPPPMPADVTATAGDHQVTVAWTPLAEATSYDVYRGTRSGRPARTPIGAGVAGPPFVDATAENGPTYYYTVIAKNAGGSSPRSAEASATPEGPPLVIEPETTTAYRLLRQATWGPRPGDVDHVKEVGIEAFLDEQLATPPSTYPTALFDQPLEMAQEQFMQLALTGPDQLRQRVAWALHKIWVVSGVEVDQPDAFITYYRLLMDGAFGNYRDLMRAVTLNPAMGRYLNMLNNRSETVTGVPANENYPREIMQLFTIGIPKLNQNGTPILDPLGAPIPAYTETDVKELARIFTGWSYGGGTTSRRRSTPRENYRVPMAPIAAYHDSGAKLFLGETFPAGQSATEDLDHALDVLFNHPNMAPFVARQLIVQLVKSNPTPGYVADIAAVFDNNGSGTRGDIAAVVRAILMHPEAGLETPNGGKLAEPVLFLVSLLRTFNPTVTDHPFMSDQVEEMGQKVFYPPSVFSYFSPGYRVRGTASPGGQPLVGPEFQILTSVTALVRANFVGSLLGGYFGSDVQIDYTPFTSIARDAAALVDHCNLVMMGGRMTLQERTEIIAAVRKSSADNASERARTAIYLTAVIASTQVDH